MLNDSKIKQECSQRYTIVCVEDGKVNKTSHDPYYQFQPALKEKTDVEVYRSLKRSSSCSSLYPHRTTLHQQNNNNHVSSNERPKEQVIMSRSQHDEDRTTSRLPFRLMKSKSKTNVYHDSSSDKDVSLNTLVIKSTKKIVMRRSKNTSEGKTGQYQSIDSPNQSRTRTNNNVHLSASNQCSEPPLSTQIQSVPGTRSFNNVNLLASNQCSELPSSTQIRSLPRTRSFSRRQPVCNDESSTVPLLNDDSRSSQSGSCKKIECKNTSQSLIRRCSLGHQPKYNINNNRGNPNNNSFIGFTDELDVLKKTKNNNNTHQRRRNNGIMTITRNYDTDIYF